MQALKAAYGLGDAPLLWRAHLHNNMLSGGFEQCRFDECMYYRRCKATGRVILLIKAHVDDLEITGVPSEIQAFRKYIETKYGQVKVQRWSFTHCGIVYIQTPTLDKITQSQKKFVEAIPYAPIPPRKKKIPSTTPCDEQQHKSFRSGTGACIWTLRTRMDKAAEIS